jgi:hypothetical protein
MTALLVVMVVTIVVAVVGYPLSRPGPQAPPDPVGPAAIVAALEDRKLVIYAGIRELGFDYRMDKLEEADYKQEVERLKAEAGGLVQQIGELHRHAPRGPDELEAEITAFREQLDGSSTAAGDVNGKASAGLFCTQCGAPAGRDDQFCAACGHPLRTS